MVGGGYSNEDLEQHRLGLRGFDDDRSGFEHDCDRILYSTQWRSLAGKSQVVASDELGIYHTRLTHSMKVAQLGRRIAERLQRVYGGPNPALVEAACMAHDIGHPPFGHAGETALQATMDELRGAVGTPDSFEGNAQTLRVLTFLAAHKYPGYRGLNLTRACLDAAMKYPWQRAQRHINPFRHAKWGVYAADVAAFEWIRLERNDDAVPIEGQVMDWADDVTYVCHDVEDFYRTGLIPLEMLFPPLNATTSSTEYERTKFLDYVADKRSRASQGFDRAGAQAILESMSELLAVPHAHGGQHADAIAVNARTGKLISYLTSAITVTGDKSAAVRYRAQLHVPDDRRAVCELLKELLWCYVVDRPAMASQRHGKERITADLLRWVHQSQQLLPPEQKEELAVHGDRLRATADYVASLTEGQAMALHRRLSGVALGSVSDNVWS